MYKSKLPSISYCQLKAVPKFGLGIASEKPHNELLQM